MRERKYRGLCIDTGKWIYGYGVIVCEYGAVVIHEQGNNVMQHTNVIPTSVCDYTGLKDKNGVEIYEGDICTKMISTDENNLAPRELHKGEIVFHYGGFCYKSGGYYYPMSRTHGVVNVIGNIYQNPELLTA